MFGFVYNMIGYILYYYPTLYKYSVYLLLMLLWYITSFVNRAHLRAISYNIGSKFKPSLDKIILNDKVRLLFKKYVIRQLSIISNTTAGFLEGIEGRINIENIVNVTSSAVNTDKLPEINEINEEIENEPEKNIRKIFNKKEYPVLNNNIESNEITEYSSDEDSKVNNTSDSKELNVEAEASDMFENKNTITKIQISNKQPEEIEQKPKPKIIKVIKITRNVK